MPILAQVRQYMKAFLLRFEPMLHTNLRYAAKGGFWLSFGSITGSIVSLGVAVAFANLAPRETYGSYKYVLAIVAVLSGFTLSGLGDAVMGATARNYDGTLRMCVRRAFLWNLLLAFGAFIGAAWYFWRGNVALGSALAAVGLFTPFIQSTGLYAAFLRGKKAFKTAAFYGMGRSVIPAMALVAAIFLVPENPTLLATVFLATSAIAAYAIYRLTLRRFVKNNAIEKGSFSFGAQASFMNILGSLASNLDKILIFQLLGAGPTAVYAMAQALPDQIDGVVSNLRTLALPRFAVQKQRGAFGMILRKAIFVFLVMLPIVGLIMLIAPYAYRLLFPAYAEAVPYAIGLLAAQVPIAAAHLPLAYLTAHQDVRSRYILGIALPIISIGLMLALVRPYGLAGIVATKIAIKFIGLSLTMTLAWRFSEKKDKPGI